MINPHIWFQPELVDVLKAFGDVAMEFENRFLITESHVPKELGESYLTRFIQGDIASVHAPYNFGLIGIPWGSGLGYGLPGKILCSTPRQGRCKSGNIDHHDRYERLADRIGDEQMPNAFTLYLTRPVSAYYTVMNSAYIAKR